MKKYLNPLRLIIFCIAVYALSVFFEAGRLLANERAFQHIGASVISFIAFTLCLLIIGYWVYIEEKERNNLKIKFGLYEWLHKLLQTGKAR